MHGADRGHQQSGSTVVFVSHDMQAVSRLCDRAYWLDGGGSSRRGRARTSSPSTSAHPLGHGRRIGSTPSWRARLRAVEVGFGSVRAHRRISAGETIGSIDVHEPSASRSTGWSAIHRVGAAVPEDQAHDQRGDRRLQRARHRSAWHRAGGAGHYVTTAWIPAEPSQRGLPFSVDAGDRLARGGPKFANRRQSSRRVSFHVQDHGVGRRRDAAATRARSGRVRPLLEWSCDAGRRSDRRALA